MRFVLPDNPWMPLGQGSRLGALRQGVRADFTINSANGDTFAALAGAQTLTNKIVDLYGTFREHIEPVAGMTIRGRNGARVLGSTALTGWNRTTISAISADIGDEGFESAAGNGCDAANWQTASTGAGSSVDTNYTTTPIAGSQMARFVKASTNCQLSNFLSSGQAILYAVGTFKLSSYSLPSNGNVIDLFQIGDGTNISCRVGLQNISGEIRFRSTVRNNGADAAHTNATPIVANTTDTWKFYFKYDKTNALAEVKLENITTAVTTTMYSAALTGTVAGNTTRLRIGDTTNALAATWVVDTVRWGTLGYPADAIACPANCWWIDDNASVKQIWAIGTTTAWAIERTSSATATAEHDWFRANGKLTYYTGGETAGDNPTTKYAGGVEGAVRAHCIAKAGVAGVTVTGIETAYSWFVGIGNKTVTDFGVYAATTAGDDWTVYNNSCHHIGYKGTITYATYTEWGDGVLIAATDPRVDSNTIHNCGRHGVAVLAIASDQAIDAVVRSNTIYDCFHSLIDLQAVGSGVQTGTVVEANNLYLTSAYETARTCDLIFAQHQDAAGALTATIRRNKVKNYREAGIHIGPRAQGTIDSNSVGKSWASAGVTSRGIFIENAASSGNTLTENVVTVDGNTTSYRAIDIDDMTKVTAARNLAWASGASGLAAQIDATSYVNADVTALRTAMGDAALIVADPLFDADLNLSSGSLAIASAADGGNLGA